MQLNKQKKNYSGLVSKEQEVEVREGSHRDGVESR